MAAVKTVRLMNTGTSTMVLGPFRIKAFHALDLSDEQYRYLLNYCNPLEVEHLEVFALAATPYPKNPPTTSVGAAKTDYAAADLDTPEKIADALNNIGVRFNVVKSTLEEQEILAPVS